MQCNIFIHPFLTLLLLGNLQDSLAKVLAGEHTNETLSSLVNAIRLVDLDLKLAVGNHGLHLLLERLVLLGRQVDEEALEGELLGDEVEEAADALLLLARGVVVRDHAAADDAALLVEGLEGRLEVIAANVLKVHVNTLGCEALEGVVRGLGLVVEAGVEAKLVEDEVELLVAADGANDLDALSLGELADNLADSAGGGGDEDGFTLLGLADVVEALVGGHTGHAESADEQWEVDVVGVGDLEEAGKELGGDRSVLGVGAHEGGDEITGGELGGVGALNAGDDRGNDNGALLERRDVGLAGLGGAHAAAHIGVERRVEDLDEDAAVKVLLEVDGAILGDEVLAGNRQALGDLLEDERLVGSRSHCRCVKCECPSDGVSRNCNI